MNRTSDDDNFGDVVRVAIVFEVEVDDYVTDVVDDNSLSFFSM